ncbi:hypothetical protein [Actinoplanes couchii]|nr:hypothetical protein [Actinoplanes couchii]MDR6317288.1 hypothetical protein [Actinoplanes couchii]
MLDDLDEDEWDELPATVLTADRLRAMLRSGDPAVRRSAIRAAAALGDDSRSAPSVPVGSLLDDPDPGVRHSVLHLLHRAGAASGRFADRLAAVAAGGLGWVEPAGPVTGPDRSPAGLATETLQRLGDPRWVAAAPARISLRRVPPNLVRCTPEVLAAIGERLVTHPADAGMLAGVLTEVARERGAGHVAGIEPELVAALPHAPRAIAGLLLSLGHADPAVIPHWRARASETADLNAALAVHRATGDTAVVVDVLRAVLSGDEPPPDCEQPAPTGLDGLDAALRPLLDLATPYLTGAADPNHPGQERQILAARVVTAVHGPGEVLPTVAAVLTDGDTPARHAADLLADLAPVFAAAVRPLEPLLHDLLGDVWCQAPAARALARLGTPVADLAPVLAAAIGRGAGLETFLLLRELHAVEAIPALEALLVTDERWAGGGYIDDIVWRDELFQDRLRETIAHARSR